ncbi:hypothetical protein ACE4Z7_24585, partial [Salmonella enterica]|uniref:hypothetical protein n=1 Tax=Salmonella enterica TaxID=28901 RepID=UPI003D2B2C6A
DFGGSYILSKKIEFSLYVVDIFKTSAPQYSYYTNNINQVYDNYYDNRQMTLTMKLNLGNFFLKTVDGKDKVSNNEEKERIAN